ncbi:MAG: TolC family protein [Campylobacterota bacterium]|nr:TolC family protein [Campylobacterota bacterium]
MKIIIGLVFSIVFLNASAVTSSLPITMDKAIVILKAQNLEIKTASLDIDSAYTDLDKVKGMNWGKLDFIQDFARSDNAGNAFGFKLTSREASFGDFGFSEFLNPLGQAIGGAANDQMPSDMSGLLGVEPKDLNYPDARNFFQTKLKYELPIFTGFKISSYVEIMKSMTKMKSLEKEQVIDEKIYQVKKSFYDMALLRESTKNLNTILDNINTLENMTKSMIDVGYAKKVDLLEVQAKKGNVQRLVLQMESNQKLLLHYISFLLNQKVNDITTPTEDIAMPICLNKDILKENLDIKKATQGLEIRKSMLNVSKSAYYPMVGGFAEVATADDSFLNDMNEHKAYTVGARLTWNIFNGGSDDADIQKSRLQHLKMQTQVQLAKKGIALKIDKIRTEIETFDNEVASLEKELILADAIYENYEGRYKEKLSSMSDVIIKQSEQIQKILELQMAKNKRNERIFALKKLANGEKR